MFSPAWLQLRESADLAARSTELARRFAAALPHRSDKPLRLIDLGAGTGANCRALINRVAGDQEWTLIENDRALIASHADAFTLWARRQGYPIRTGGGRIIIETGAANWTITALPLDLMCERNRVAELAVDGVTASALFDLVSAEWTGWLARAIAGRRVPFLAALTVDGRRHWQPPLVEDAIVAAAFRRHQQCDKGFGPALGAAAVDALARALSAEGFDIASAASDWRLDSKDDKLLPGLIAGEAHAAREVMPEATATIAAWEEQRLSQWQDGKLSLTIGHRDLLALPC